MAIDSTIRIESVQELKDRLRSAGVLTNWKRFSDFLEEFVGEIEKAGENPEFVATISSEKFPIDLATLKFLYAYLGSGDHFVRDFAEESALAKILEIITDTKQKYGSALEGLSSNDTVSRQRQTALTFFQQLTYDLEPSNLQGETESEGTFLAEALPAVFADDQILLKADNPSQVNALKQQIEEQFNELRQLIKKYDRPETIELETQVTTALSAARAQAQANDDETAQRQLTQASEIQETAQSQLRESLEERRKEQLDKIRNSQALLFSLVEKYSEDTSFDELFLSTLIQYIRVDRIDFQVVLSFTAFLGYLRDLFETLLANTRDFVEKKTEAYKKRTSFRQKNS